MPKTSKHLIIGSVDAYGGKSTASIAVGSRLQAAGFQIGWGKPLASVDTFGYGLDFLDDDLSFVPNTLSIPSDRQPPSLLSLNRETLLDRLRQEAVQSLEESLKRYWENAHGDIMLLEGPNPILSGLKAKNRLLSFDYRIYRQRTRL